MTDNMEDETSKGDIKHLENPPQVESTEDIFRRKCCIRIYTYWSIIS